MIKDFFVTSLQFTIITFLTLLTRQYRDERTSYNEIRSSFGAVPDLKNLFFSTVTQDWKPLCKFLVTKSEETAIE